MEAYILTVLLYRNGPMVTMRVPDCEAGVVWLHAAWKWAERSGVRIEDGPLYGCRRVET